MFPDNYKILDYFKASPMQRKKNASFNVPSCLLSLCAKSSIARAYRNRSNSAKTMTTGVTGLRPRKGHSVTPRYHFGGKKKGFRASVPLKVKSTDAKRRLTSARRRQQKHAGPQGDSAGAAKRSSVSSLIKAKRSRKAASRKRSNISSLNKVTPPLHEAIHLLRAELKETIKISKCLVAEAMKLNQRL